MIASPALNKANRTIRRKMLGLIAVRMPANPEVAIIVTNDWGPKSPYEKAEDLSVLCAYFHADSYDIRYGRETVFGVQTAYITPR